MSDKLYLWWGYKRYPLLSQFIREHISLWVEWRKSKSICAHFGNAELFYCCQRKSLIYLLSIGWDDRYSGLSWMGFEGCRRKEYKYYNVNGKGIFIDSFYWLASNASGQTTRIKHNKDSPFHIHLLLIATVFSWKTALTTLTSWNLLKFYLKSW